jgi:integrase
MPAHIKFRKDRDCWYLVDGSLMKSLETKKKGMAQFKLEEYIRDKFMFKPTPTVKEFYDTWIEKKIEPLVRRAQVRDYKQHFSAYILPKFKDVRLLALGTGDLTAFRVELLNRGLKLKTVRNIIDSSFRALYRDARAELEALGSRNPFADIQWPRTQRERPDPFTPQERDRIIAHWAENDFFYFPWLFTLFHTGMRPSEASALTWANVDLEQRTLTILKSRYAGTDSLPKTSGSARVIEFSEEVAKVLKILPSKELGLSYVFLNKFGQPMNAKKWSEHNWAEPLKELGIRHRKFYATRHTFITEMIKRGENPLAVAQHCGTSLAMIQADYCGTLGLRLNQSGAAMEQRNLNIALCNRTEIKPQAEKPLKNMVAGPGFEPGTSRL